MVVSITLPSGKRLHNYGKSQSLMRKSTYLIGHSQSRTVSLPEGKHVEGV